MSARQKLRQVIFGVETRAGRLFDVFLIIAIVASVVLVMLETVEEVDQAWAARLRAAQWVFTALFTVEYALRLYSAEKRWGYALSFFGIVDFLAVVPVYAGLALPGGGPFFIMVRVLRVLRIFRVFGMAGYERETRVLLEALRASARRIIVFLLFIMTLVVMLGSLMYAIEGRSNEGFSSIPRSVYWAVVTLTTVGYGDISPRTAVGQAIAGLIMILGYSLIVVPTGFVSVAVASAAGKGTAAPAAPARRCLCGKEQPDPEARFCSSCGKELPEG